MKKDLQDKLGKYTALAGAMLTTGGLLHGQAITYTLVNDTLDTNDFALIDLDQDGAPDFTVLNYASVSSSASYQIGVALPYGSVGNQVAGSIPNSYPYAARLNQDDAIDDNINWIDTASFNGYGYMAFIYNGTNPYSLFWDGGVTDGYLGLKLKSGGSTYYGWARLDVFDGDNTIILHDYAVYMIDGKTINAGQKIAVGIDEVEMVGARVFTHNKQLYVSLPQDIATAKLTVTNILGQVVYEGNVNSGNREISLDNTNAGVYIVTLTSGKAKFVKKVVIN